jgi:hypothetical protein
VPTGVDLAASQRLQVTDKPQATRGASVTKRFTIGDRVSWNSEAGRVRGTIMRLHTQNVDYKGYTHHASTEFPQYQIKSSKKRPVDQKRDGRVTMRAVE